MAHQNKFHKSNSTSNSVTVSVKASKFEDCTEVNKLLSTKLGFLPQEARDEISRKVPGLVFSGTKYASWRDVEKTMSKHFWKGEDDDGVEVSEDGETTSVSCSTCEELRDAKERASNSEQKRKNLEDTYKRQFNTLSDQLNSCRNELDTLKAEKKAWAGEKETYETLLSESEKSSREKDRTIQDAKNAISVEESLRREKQNAEDNAESAWKAQREALEREKKAQGDLITAQNKIKELENKIKRLDTSGDSGGESFSKRQLKDQVNELKKEIRNLNVQLENEKKAKDEAVSEGLALKYSNNAKTIDALMKARDEYKKLFEDASADIDKGTAEINTLKEQLKAAKTALSEEQKKTEALQLSLNARHASESAGLLANDGTLFYDEELTDFIHILAERNFINLEGSKDNNKREYDLSEKVMNLFSLSDWQERMRTRIKDAAKSKDIRQFMRLGFSDGDGGKHEKLYFHGNPRYTMIIAGTPSDNARGFLNLESNVKNMLLITPAKGTEETVADSKNN